MAKDTRNKVKQIRLQLGYTQNEFANILGVSKTLISKIETGNISLSPKLQKKIISQFKLPESIFLSTDEFDLCEKNIKDEMYVMIKQNFRNDAKSAYLITNAFFDIVDTSNMSEDATKVYVEYICNILTGVASQFKERTSVIRNEKKIQIKEQIKNVMKEERNNNLTRNNNGK